VTDGAFCLFDTPIGRCAIAWRGDPIVRLRLPEESDEKLRERMAGGCEAPPPPAIARAIERIVGLLGGAADDLADVEVSLDGVSAFERSVYDAIRRIGPGETRTYGDVAAMIGAPAAAQAVGLALGRNPVPIVVPCHRVLATGGRSGGFTAPGGTATKFRILEIEGARRADDGGLFESLPLKLRPA
jgi:methylated-DNA-[protein]-cysteine S-methyltransferase